MKAWRKVPLPAVLALVLAAALAACGGGGGGDDAADALRGTWRGPWQSTSGESGTLTITFGDGGYLANDGATVWTGSYALNGNTLTSTLNDPGGGTISIVGTLDGGTISLSITSSRITGESISATLTKAA